MSDINNEEYRDLTEEEASKLTLAELLERERMRPKLIRVVNEEMYTNIKKLIENNSDKLRGKYNFYCVYQEPLGSTVRYALIHSFYIESETVKLEDMDRIIFEDGTLIHKALEKSKLDFDYFFIMPYFDFTDEEKGSVLLNDRILETNELDKFEKDFLIKGIEKNE